MRILHTADWHLGARLVDHDRSEEHGLFLAWLVAEIRDRGVDLLIVAGDVFDSANPPQSALTQYYQFLAELVSTTRCETLIIGGNHDSAATLNAPRELLLSLRVQVHGAAAVEADGAVLEYPNAVVCAVPFLRERDVRTAAAGQSHDEVVEALRLGIEAYYLRVLEAARAKANGRPIIATGHLTAVGVTSASSERQIHIGNLGAVGAGCFDGFDYTALGHIHRPQLVAGREQVRYSGSPLPLAFDERGTAKQVLLLSIEPQMPLQIEPVPLPVWRVLSGVSCAVAGLAEALKQAREQAPADSLEPWIELSILDPVPPADLDRLVRAASDEAGVRVLKIVRATAPTLADDNLMAGRNLKETTPEEVFTEKLRRDGVEVDSEDYLGMLGTFRELISLMQEAPSV